MGDNCETIAGSYCSRPKMATTDPLKIDSEESYRWQKINRANPNNKMCRPKLYTYFSSGFSHHVGSPVEVYD